jgi:hypothetical protein
MSKINIFIWYAVKMSKWLVAGIVYDLVSYIVQLKWWFVNKKNRNEVTDDAPNQLCLLGGCDFMRIADMNRQQCMWINRGREICVTFQNA